MRLEKNIEKIQRFAQEKHDENEAFRRFLQAQNPDLIDELVHKLNDRIAAQIDCLECGYCCQNLRPIAADEVLLNFVEPKNLAKYKYADSFACKHLDGKKCTIYTNRFEECKMFPYLYRNDFLSRLSGIFGNYEFCPIVFNVVEQLKLELFKK
jgi:hypothetical protein